MKIRNPTSRNHFHIPQKDRVIEVRGGHHPHSRSKVIVDTKNNRIAAYNLQLDFSYKFGDNISISAGADILSGRSKINPGLVNTFLFTGNTQSLDPYLGTEFDFTSGFKLAKNIPLKIGSRHLFPAGGMQGIKAGHLDLAQYSA